MTVNLITLGCSRNLVDSEHLLYHFQKDGYRVLHNEYVPPADIVIINTCGFILDAKQESVDTILYYVGEKEKGNLGKLFVMGCLSQRYREDLRKELPEVDGFFGVSEMPQILQAAGIRSGLAGQVSRLITPPGHYAYLKISEGCDRTCSFCAIPGIRGKQVSLSIGQLRQEGAYLGGQGVKELILIAQDLTAYGRDLYRKRALPRLLKELIQLQDVEWIRLHYAYPTGFPLEVINLMAAEPKICNYLDIPIQHINDQVLSSMGRGYSRKQLEALLERFRSGVPDVALRTTVLVGYPEESEEAFRELLEFLAAFRFDRLGVFPYSHEADTPAGRNQPDRIPEKIKIERAGEVMKLQQEISLGINREKIGKVYRVLIDRAEGSSYVGRTEYDSPEVDNEVIVTADKKLHAGSFYDVKITDAEEFDLLGVVIS
ncbi:MAG TPA: 30S ribosomal protein S12 methylthiotransferase RimO [Bacteroides sp.]|nr:30S ribosomal protein S12 methylthiotransferase RimO [Bacteroides sp.]